MLRDLDGTSVEGIPRYKAPEERESGTIAPPNSVALPSCPDFLRRGEQIWFGLHEE